MSTIIVFGATGFAGGHIARELVDRGHRVVGVSRSITADVASDIDPAQKAGPARRAIEPRPGSVFDESFVHTLVEEEQPAAVIIALRFDAGSGGNLGERFTGLLALAEEHSFRVGVIGGAGSLLLGEGGPRLVDTMELPEEWKAEVLAAAEALEVLRADGSGADWFFVSPAAGFGHPNPGERTGTYRLGGDVLLSDDEGVSYISGADLAIAIADEIEHPAHHRSRFTVAY